MKVAVPRDEQLQEGDGLQDQDFLLELATFEASAAYKVSVFAVFLVRIIPDLD